MNIEKMEHISPLELRRMVRDLIIKCRGQGPAAKEIGTSQAAVSQFMHGYNANRSILHYFGLEMRKVYVRKPEKRRLA